METRHLLEALEPRVLLSAVGLGDLPTLNKTVEIDGATHRILLPGDTTPNSLPTASGSVFLDMDGDGMWDPNEHALTGVKVFLDADRDGVHDENERSTLTGSAGNFVVPILSSGTFSLRAELPRGYKAARPGSDVTSVQLTSGRGVGGLTLGLARTGFDLGVAISEVSMPDRFRTGKTATVPVLVTNRGDQAVSGAGVKVRLFLSGDPNRSGNDLRLTTVALGRGLEPGESVKLMLDVELADALADFTSYLIVDVVGRGARGDVSRADNVAATAAPVLFVGSKRKPGLTQEQIDTAIDNWDVTTPYGGQTPGYGYTGTTDLGTTLGNWNAGTPIGGGVIDSAGGGVIAIPGGLETRTHTESGAPASIRGLVYHDRNASGHQNGGEWGLSGVTVYLDTNNNGRHDGGEPSAVTDAGGGYRFTGLPTEVRVTESRSWGSGDWTVTKTVDVSEKYTVRVVPLEGWRAADASALSFPVSIYSGVNYSGIDFGLYAPPRVGGVTVEGGYLAYGTPTTVSAQGVVDPDGSIDRVVFYYDGDNDGLADDILGVDTDGSDGYAITASGPVGESPADRARVFAVAQDNDGHLAGAVTDTALRFIVEVSAGKSLAFREADGTVVTVTMTGPGVARLSLKGEAMCAWDTADAVELTGSATIHDIYLQDTTAVSKLKVRTAGRGEAKVAAMTGSVYGSTPMGVVSAPKLELQNGGVRMTGGGAIRSIAVTSINGVEMPGQAFGNGVKIAAADITGDITLGSPLKLLNAGTLRHVDLTAPSADRIQVKSDYVGGSVTLTAASFGYGLDLLRVGQQIKGVEVRSAASIHTVQAGSMVRSSVTVGVRDSAFGTSSPASTFMFRGAIENLSVTGGVFQDSRASAWSIGTVSLDAVRRGAAGSVTGLTYHILGSYDGPAGIEQIVV